MKKEPVQIDFSEVVRDCFGEVLTPLEKAIVEYFEKHKTVGIGMNHGRMRTSIINAVQWFEIGFKAGYEKGKEDAEKE